MDFNIGIFGVVSIGGIDVWITQTVVMTWIIMAVLIAFAVVVRVKLQSFAQVPSGFQNVIELIIETFDGFVKSTAGPKLQFLGNWYFMVFTFIFVANLSGIFGFRPPTADWNMTFAFALSTFILIQAMGLKYRGGKYIKGVLFEPHPLFLPMNIIGELARPVSLSFRLFGNILAGMILMGVVYNVAPVFVQIAIPAALHGYFDLITAALQTYIFCALSLAFISNATGLQDE